MAATSLWHIEGRLKDLISYVENPEKTVPNKEMQDLKIKGQTRMAGQTARGRTHCDEQTDRTGTYGNFRRK